MLPTLAETVLFWSGGGKRQVLVTHEEQSALAAGRPSRLQPVLADGVGALPPDDADETGSSAAGISPLAGLVMVDSRDDPRVQVADLLAGVPGRLPEIVDDRPLQPYLSATSLRDPRGIRTGGRWKGTGLRRAPRQRPTGVKHGRSARMTLQNWNICVQSPVAAA
jgi:hypothetical protein